MKVHSSSSQAGSGFDASDRSSRGCNYANAPPSPREVQTISKYRNSKKNENGNDLGNSNSKKCITLDFTSIWMNIIYEVAKKLA